MLWLRSVANSAQVEHALANMSCIDATEVTNVHFLAMDSTTPDKAGRQQCRAENHRQ
jgi:hypothetical protein